MNDYLVPFGATEFTLFKAQFVYTGVLLLLPPAVSYLFVEFGRWLVGLEKMERRFGHHHDARRWFGAAVGGVLAFCFFTLLLWSLSNGPFSKAISHGGTLALTALLLVRAGELAGGRRGSSPQHTDSQRLIARARARLHAIPAERAAIVLVLVGAVATHGVFAWVILAPALGLLFLLEPRTPPRTWRLVGAPGRLLALALIVVVAFMAYLGKFVDDVYPAVPAQFGGGQPVVATLSLTPAGLKEAGALGIPVQPSTSQSENVTLLFQGSDFDLICLAADEKGNPILLPPGSVPGPTDCISAEHLVAIQLDRSLVSAVSVKSQGR